MPFTQREERAEGTGKRRGMDAHFLPSSRYAGGSGEARLRSSAAAAAAAGRVGRRGRTRGAASGRRCRARSGQGGAVLPPAAAGLGAAEGGAGSSRAELAAEALAPKKESWRVSLSGVNRWAGGNAEFAGAAVVTERWFGAGGDPQPAARCGCWTERVSVPACVES